jgi:hypothetical protein
VIASSHRTSRHHDNWAAQAIEQLQTVSRYDERYDYYRGTTVSLFRSGACAPRVKFGPCLPCIASSGQGAQASLLESRLRYAAEQGCDIAMMCALPGSASQRNAERQGFRIAYTRIKWCLNQPAAEI